MIDFDQIDIVPAGDEDFEFSYRVKTLAQGPYVKKIWGQWEEQTQRRFHRDAWNEHRPDIITHAGKQIGTFSVDQDDDGSLHIRQLFILPEYQRKGIGTFLISRVLAEADAKGKIVKLSFLKVSPVMSLYSRLGFHLVEEAETYLRMERQPNESAR